MFVYASLLENAYLLSVRNILKWSEACEIRPVCIYNMNMYFKNKHIRLSSFEMIDLLIDINMVMELKICLSVAKLYPNQDNLYC